MAVAGFEEQRTAGSLLTEYEYEEEIVEPGSNVTVERDLQLEKQLAQRRSMEEGMQMDESNEQFAKVCFSMHER
jgi:hypothetical protein